MYEMKDVYKVGELEYELKGESETIDCLYELDDQSFYPPEDPRVYISGVIDIDGGDTFTGYAEYFWEVYGNEIYDDFNFNE